MAVVLRSDASNQQQCLHPSHVLHTDAEVTCLSFLQHAPGLPPAQVKKLASVVCCGDSSGIVSLWDLAIRRPFASFCAPFAAVVGDPQVSHSSDPGPAMSNPASILHCEAWAPSGTTRCFLVLSQGRNQLARLWVLMEHCCDENCPEDCESEGEYKEAFLCHSFYVPQFGFCGAATCIAQWPLGGASGLWHVSLPGDNDGLLNVYALAIQSPLLNQCRREDVVKRQGLVTVNAGGGLTCGQVMQQRFIPALETQRVFIAVCFESGHVVICSHHRATRVFALRAFPDPVMCCAWSRSRTVLHLFVASAEGAVQSYDVDIDQLISATAPPAVVVPRWELKMPLGVGVMSLRPDGKLLLLGGWDATIRLYDALCGTVVSILVAHTAIVTDLCFDECSPTHFLSSSHDKTIAMWHLPI